MHTGSSISKYIMPLIVFGELLSFMCLEVGDYTSRF